MTADVGCSTITSVGVEVGVGVDISAGCTVGLVVGVGVGEGVASVEGTVAVAGGDDGEIIVVPEAVLLV